MSDLNEMRCSAKTLLMHSLGLPDGVAAKHVDDMPEAQLQRVCEAGSLSPRVRSQVIKAILSPTLSGCQCDEEDCPHSDGADTEQLDAPPVQESSDEQQPGPSVSGEGGDENEQSSDDLDDTVPVD